MLRVKEMCKRKFSVAFFMAIFLSLFVVTNVSARTRIVPYDNSTIQAAVDASAPGDTIFIKNGIYTILDPAGFPQGGALVKITKNNLTLIGESRDGVFLKGRTDKSGESSDLWIKGILVESQNVTIKNLTVQKFKGGTGQEERGFGILFKHPSSATLDGGRVENVRLTDNGQGLRAVNSSNLMITDSLIDENDETGIWLVNADNTTIANNLIVSALSGSVGIRVESDTDIATISSNDVSITGVAIKIQGTSVTVYENLIHDSGTGVQIVNPSGIQLICNTITENGTGVLVSGTITDSRFDFNNIFGNTVYGANNTTVSTLNFENTWWGSSTGPTHSGNLGGTGDTVSDYVDYEPWLLAKKDMYWKDYNGKEPDGYMPDIDQNQDFDTADWEPVTENSIKYFFDFDKAGDVDTMPGWTSFTIGAYSPPGSHYGWSSTTDINDLKTVSGDALEKDFHYSDQDRTFKADISDGTYKVTVFMGGHDEYAHDNMRVSAEGVVKLPDVTTSIGEVKALSFVVTVDDGTLNLLFEDNGGSNIYWVVAGVKIEKLLTGPGYLEDNYCAPVAEADSLWWLSKKHGLNLNLTDFNNDGKVDILDLVQELAWLMDTNAQRTGTPRNGTLPADQKNGVIQFLTDHGLDDFLYAHKKDKPTFTWVEEEVKACQDVKLDLGFWQVKTKTGLTILWERCGGHAVNVAGVDSNNAFLALSDPDADNAEAGSLGVVRGLNHPHPDPTGHNDAVSASHDIFKVENPSPSPGGLFGLTGPYWTSASLCTTYEDNNAPNGPKKTETVTYTTDPGLNVGDVRTEIETAVVVSPKIFVVKPNGGEIIPALSHYTVQWSAVPTAVTFDLKYSHDKGKNWKDIANGVPGTSYIWIVPPPPSYPRNQYLVRVIAYDASGDAIGMDTSDAPATIDVVKLTSPDAKEILYSGKQWTITWETYGTSRPVFKSYLSYTDDGGASWKDIGNCEGDCGWFRWTVPTVTTKKTCKVRVILKDAALVVLGKDKSDVSSVIKP